MRRVLRVAFSDLEIPERNASLRSIYGDDVEIIVISGQPSMDFITSEAARINAAAIAFDVLPQGAAGRLEELPIQIDILRPVFEEGTARDRFGTKVRKRHFLGYESIW